jgi:hypothetical protein
VTATTLREGWQRNNVGVQKPKGLRERRMERERTRWIFFGGGGEYVGIFEVFFHFFYIILILFNLMWHPKTQVLRHMVP